MRRQRHEAAGRVELGLGRQATRIPSQSFEYVPEMSARMGQVLSFSPKLRLHPLQSLVYVIPRVCRILTVARAHRSSEMAAVVGELRMPAQPIEPSSIEVTVTWQFRNLP